MPDSSPAKHPKPVKEHRLTLVEVVEALIADGVVDAVEGGKFLRERRYFRGDIHPLVVIA